jgi:RNA polymerase sigma-70 factor (ECF subfamily)
MEVGETAPVVLARAREGDGDAFRALVEQHSRGAYRLAFRLTGNEQDAEDVVQESFIRAYRQIGRFEARANFGTWLHRIVVNCAMDALRSRRSRRTGTTEPLDDVAELVSGRPGPERLARSAEIVDKVQASLGALSDRERVAFTLRHCEGRTIEEIGQTMGLRTNAVKHCIFRAVRKLRATLEPLRGES